MTTQNTILTVRDLPRLTADILARTADDSMGWRISRKDLCELQPRFSEPGYFDTEDAAWDLDWVIDLLTDLTDEPMEEPLTAAEAAEHRAECAQADETMELARRIGRDEALFHSVFG